LTIPLIVPLVEASVVVVVDVCDGIDDDANNGVVDDIL
jgi:hypothetical protein